MIKYICDTCGAEFDVKYNYIDHASLAGSSYVYGYRNLDKLVEDIVFDNKGSLRYEYDVKERLNCVMHWKTINNRTKELVKTKVNALYLEHSAIKDKAYNDAENTVKTDSIYARYLREALDKKV